MKPFCDDKALTRLKAIKRDERPRRTTPEPGDLCSQPGCNGWIETYRSMRTGTSQTRYLRCWACKKPAGKQIVPGSTIRRRRKRNYLNK